MLIAEDNSDDLELTRVALRRAKVNTPVHFVSDGAQVVAYLKGEAPFSDRSAFPLPRLLVLDIKMPYLSGFEVLEWLRAHEEYSFLPTTMLSSSRLESDIEKAYALGANAYVTKPGQFNELVAVLQKLYGFWRMCEVPRVPRSL